MHQYALAIQCTKNVWDGIPGLDMDHMRCGSPGDIGPVLRCEYVRPVSGVPFAGLCCDRVSGFGLEIEPG